MENQNFSIKQARRRQLERVCNLCNWVCLPRLACHIESHDKKLSKTRFKKVFKQQIAGNAYKCRGKVFASAAGLSSDIKFSTGKNITKQAANSFVTRGIGIISIYLP